MSATVGEERFTMSKISTSRVEKTSKRAALRRRPRIPVANHTPEGLALNHRVGPDRRDPDRLAHVPTAEHGVICKASIQSFNRNVKYTELTSELRRIRHEQPHKYSTQPAQHGHHQLLNKLLVDFQAE